MNHKVEWMFSKFQFLENGFCFCFLDLKGNGRSLNKFSYKIFAGKEEKQACLSEKLKCIDY